MIASRQDIESILDTLPGMVWATGPDSGCIYFNRRWLEFTGRTLEQEVGNGWELSIHPSDRERRLCAFRDAEAARETFRVEYRLRHGDGNYRRVVDEAAPRRGADGEFCGYLGCCLEIDGAPALGNVEGEGGNARSIFNTGPEGGCREVDDAWTAMTGLDREKTLGAGWLSALHPDDYGSAREQFEESFRKREPFRVECRVVGTGGRVSRVRFEGSPRISPAGDLEGYEGGVVSLESGGRKRGESEGASHFESFNVLVGGIAHDFNNLLTPILLNLSMAQSQLEREKGMFVDDILHRLRESEEAAMRAQTLANRLLAFGRGANPVKQTLALEGLIREGAAQSLEEIATRAKFTIPEDLWTGSVDPDQFREMIHSLLRNASEAMGGEGTVRIRAENVEKVDHPGIKGANGPHVRVTVLDDGPGVRFDVRDRIFDPYFSTKPENSGLGLSTAEAIARQHLGHLVMDAEQLQGASFSIYLPAAAPFEAPPATAGTGAPSAAGRILVMDDENLVRSSVAGILKAYGYEVETAENGEQALEIYARCKSEAHPIDITLMDLTIHGGMGGKEAIGRLIALDPEAIAVVCTGYSNDLITENFENYGFRGAIKKPFQPDDLNTLLRELIHG
ncbi:MAG: PAS domain-containing protein, partial [Verrucomicrobiales bacterium]